jgi:hypothetical protein
MADQLSGSLLSLAGSCTHLDAPTTLVRALGLSRSRAFRGLVERLVADPRRIIGLYNEAATSHPDAGVAALRIGAADDEIELPLWVVPTHANGVRRRCLVHDAREWLAAAGSSESIDTERSTLAPRALLMTGFVRLFLCDLFIHGLGGEKYDKITEQWFRDFLGLSLAPTVTVSATLRLTIDLDGRTLPSGEDVAISSWTAHKARHDPGLLGEHAGATRKAELVEQIRRLKHDRRRAPANVARVATAELFREMQRLLEQARERHTTELSELDRAAAAARASLDEIRIADDRTWCFVLYQTGQVNALRAEIDAAIR